MQNWPGRRRTTIQISNHREQRNRQTFAGFAELPYQTIVTFVDGVPGCAQGRR